jgi:cytochrome b pre-mRNA-processing protein 3
MTIFGRSRPSAGGAAAERLYRAVVAQARQPSFYTTCGVADTPDGRFDLIALHAALVIRRLSRHTFADRRLAQALFDYMFADLDQNLREMGVGDLGVGKRIKAMAKGFYGRLAAYDAAIVAADTVALGAALRRNLYRKEAPAEAQVAAMAAYVLAEAEALAARPLEALVTGERIFGAAPGVPTDATQAGVS